MKTTLKETLELAKKGVITNENDIRRIIERVKNITLVELESVTDFFDFVRRFDYIEEEEREKYYKDFKFKKILDIVDMFRADNEEEDLCFYLKSIMMGFFTAEAIQDIRFFNNISLLKFLYLYRDIDHKYFIERAEQYLGCDVDIGMSMYDFFDILRKKFYESWDICREIDVFRMEILTCGEFLDTIFCDCMLNGDNE